MSYEQRQARFEERERAWVTNDQAMRDAYYGNDRDDRDPPMPRRDQPCGGGYRVIRKTADE